MINAAIKQLKWPTAIASSTMMMLSPPTITNLELLPSPAPMCQNDKLYDYCLQLQEINAAIKWLKWPTVIALSMMLPTPATIAHPELLPLPALLYQNDKPYDYHLQLKEIDATIKWLKWPSVIASAVQLLSMDLIYLSYEQVSSVSWYCSCVDGAGV